LLTREQIKGVNDTTLTEVEVPEWGGSVFVRSLSGGDVAKLRDRFAKTKEDDKFALMLVACVCSEDGAQLFDESDIGWLREKNMRVLLSLVNECNAANGFDDDETEKN